MSKSLGNVIMAKELVQKIGYGPYRLLILNVPYRQPLNYRDELLKQAQTDYEKIISAKRNLIRRLQIEFSIIEYQEQLFNEEILAIKKEFIDALSHDFNTANAITSIIKITKLVNNITRQKDLIISYAGELLTLLDEMLWVLGIDQEIEPLNEEDLQLVKKWQNARINKQFDLADKYRQIMINKGINM